MHSLLQPNPVQQSKLFAMGADNFVSLLYTMSHKHKDEVFMVTDPSVFM